MDHAALDRTGTYDCHLDHQVVKAARPQPGEHGHLGPALDLENTDRIGPACHLVNGGIFRRDGRQRQAPSIMILDQVKAFVDGRQHAETEAVHLEDAEGVQIILVPFDHGSVGHGGVLDGDDFG